MLTGEQSGDGLAYEPEFTVKDLSFRVLPRMPQWVPPCRYTGPPPRRAPSLMFCIFKLQVLISAQGHTILLFTGSPSHPDYVTNTRGF